MKRIQNLNKKQIEVMVVLPSPLPMPADSKCQMFNVVKGNQKKKKERETKFKAAKRDRASVYTLYYEASLRKTKPSA